MLPEVKARLLASMDAGRLVVLCGAGLSMAPPSKLPSAYRVAEMCFDAYQLRVDPHIDPALRHNLEALAEHFATQNTLKTYFIGNLVPWKEFVRPPNPGHAAVADFLITKAAAAGLSSNYDILIERQAWEYGADFHGSLDGDEATACSHVHGPLLKFHGCAQREPLATVWAPSQLTDATIAARINKSKIWLTANLRQKDLLVVGLWSDWDYLNNVIGGALQGLDPLSVTVIDPSDIADLQTKAPDLWALAHQPNVAFEHVQESGADALDELRKAFSENYLRQVLDTGRTAFEAVTGISCDPAWLNVTGLDSESLYDWRRDAEGVPSGRPALTKHPRNGEMFACFHLLLRHAGAVQKPLGYTLAGRRIRIINGAGAALSSVAEKFIEPPTVSSADVYVAAGANDLGVPAHVIRTGIPGSVMRPAASGEWRTFEQARAELGV